MALFHVVCRAASSVAPVTIRALRFVHSAVGSAFQNHLRREITKGTTWFSRRAATSIVAKSKYEEILPAVLDEESQCVVESDPHPFPLSYFHALGIKPKHSTRFEVEDLPSIPSITLRRKHGNEEIKVEVLLSGDVGEDNHEESSGRDTGSTGEIQVNITVTVAKGGGPFLEFICTGHGYEVSIESIAFKHKQRTESDAVNTISFSDLDEDLQKGLHKYLEVRGITPERSAHLCDYMIDRSGERRISVG